MASIRRKVALGIFAWIAACAPLAFGAVDRSVQASLVVLFACGLFAVPMELPRLSRRAGWMLAAVLAILCVKEFAPSACFGATAWRRIVTQELQLALPWTHHPEPGRALDALLALGVGAMWFAWVRTLAADRDDRLVLAWCMAGAGAVLAVVCLVMNAFPHADNMIYGFRYTPGWAGFGPFPNRNHTAGFLAMSVLVGCGCVARAGMRGRRRAVAGGLALVALALVALLQSRSRGGLVGLTAGLFVFGALTIGKMRDRKTVAIVLAAGLITATLCMAFGAGVLSRFGDAREGDLPTNLRWSIWRDALAMWRDAPLFGHGLDTFAQVFPFYQTLKLENLMLENKVVLHPESSWLLALIELGALPMLAAGAGFAFFAWKNLRAAMQGARGFFIRAAGFAASTALLVQSMWDVPAHRWGTAGLGLAALALACPLSSRTPRIFPGTKSAFALLALALFWALPFFVNAPRWSPTTATRVQLRNSLAPGSVPDADIEAVLRCFPLNADLHYMLGVRELERPGGASGAWRDFSMATRLRPNSWNIPSAAASMARPVSSGMALHFWAVAVARAGARADSVFAMAWKNTAGTPDGEWFWTGFAWDNPRLLLTLALSVEDDTPARASYDRWWKTRAFAAPLDRSEIDNLYHCLPRLGRREHLDEWMRRHRELEASDFKTWAFLLHEWKDDAAAWKVLSARIPEPPFPPSPREVRPELLESRHRDDPADWVNAQLLAQHWTRTGATERANQLCITAAAAKNAPPWFLEKAAYAQAAGGRHTDAVLLLLREK